MGKITKIEVQKKHKDRLNIFIDDEFAFGCDGELVYKFSLNKGSSIDAEKLSNIIKEEEFIKCKSYCLNVVSRNLKTEKEIITKLSEKGYEEDTIERALEFLKEYKFINDEKYALMFSKDKIIKSGRKKIEYDLKRKGVDNKIIKHSLDNLDEEVELNNAKKLALKKYNLLKNKEEDKRKIYNKLSTYLLGRGYEYGLIKKVVSSILSDLEEDL
ncbi:recombination regulator RecX [Clostridium hydrogeniformans]|uniref:recombination regulator RecX n=1 Tax=Clostridium hydrogeniformans TaxID=349933 RepID=UPI0004881DEC|nr:recombination regulator RecX [Clostridium hydrogeniformans]